MLVASRAQSLRIVASSTTSLGRSRTTPSNLRLTHPPTLHRAVQTAANSTSLVSSASSTEPFSIKLHEDTFNTFKCDPPELTLEVKKDDLVEMYREMRTMRRMEMAAEKMYMEQLIRGFCHLSIGQEAVSVGINHAILPTDQVITAYRCHPFIPLRGGSIAQVLSELLGRKGGISKGKGGSMHMFTETFRGGHGIVGAHVPLGTGIAWAEKYQEGGSAEGAQGSSQKATVCLYGDGAANQGQVAEALNMAKLWNLPIIYGVENNKYGMGTSAERAAANPQYYTRGDLIPGIQVNAMNVLAVVQATRHARKWTMEDKKGPIILEFVTYRYAGHSMSDPGTTYRTKDEVKDIRNTRDPIRGLGEHLEAWGLVNEGELKEIDQQAKKTVDGAVEEAKKSPDPDVGELWTDVYAAGSATSFRRGRERGEIHHY